VARVCGISGIVPVKKEYLVLTLYIYFIGNSYKCTAFKRIIAREMNECSEILNDEHILYLDHESWLLSWSI
jgi:hypothetical protein